MPQYEGAGALLQGAWPDGDINGPTNITPAMPSGIIAGDYLFALITGDFLGPDPVFPAGWTVLGLPRPYDPSNGAQSLAYKVAAGGDLSPTVTISTGAGGLYWAQVFRYSDIDGIGASNIAAVVDDATWSMSVPSIASTADNSVALIFNMAAETTSSPLQAGWTRDVETFGTWATLDIVRKALPTIGSPSGAYTTTERSNAVAWVVEVLSPPPGNYLEANSTTGSTTSALVVGTYSADGGSSVAVAGELAVSWSTFVTIAEAISAASAGSAPTIYFETISESASATTGASAYSLFILAVNSSASANGAGAASAIYALSAESVAALMTGTQFVADFTDGWAYNLNTGAASFYEGMAFNSFALIDGEYYGCNAAGIYRLTGDDDAGADIQATITLGTSRLDSDAIKSVPFAYVGAKSAEPMLLTCRVEGQEYSYEFSRETAVMAPAKVKTGKGLEGTYWQIEISNQNGANLDLDHLELITAPKSRKV